MKKLVQGLIRTDNLTIKHSLILLACFANVVYADDECRALLSSPFQKDKVASYFAIPQDSLRDYTDDGFKTLSKKLQKEKNSKARMEALKTLNQMELSLLTFPALEGTVYSGARLSNQAMRETYRVGNTFKAPFNISASKNIQTALKFIKLSKSLAEAISPKLHQRKEVLFIIKSKTGHSIKAISNYPREEEVLFSSHSHFYVKDKHPAKVDEKDIDIIYLQETRSAMKNFNESILGHMNPDETRDWMDALSFVRKSVQENAVLDLNFLISLHKIVSLNMPFTAAISRRNQTHNNLSESFSGILRSHPIDYFISTGDYDEKYFSSEDIEQYQLNPFFNVQNIRKINTEKYSAQVHFVNPKDIERITKEVLNYSAAKIQNAPTYQHKLIAIFQLYKALISIHPFADGNGRAIRLFIYAHLLKEGFPIDFFPNIWEYQAPVSLLVRSYLEGYWSD